MPISWKWKRKRKKKENERKKLKENESKSITNQLFNFTLVFMLGCIEE